MKRFSLIFCVVFILGTLFLGCSKKKENIVTPANNVSPATSNTQKHNDETPQVTPVKKNDFVANPYHPIIIEWKDEKGIFSCGSLLGGSKDGKWLEIENFKVNYNGKLMSKEEYNEAIMEESSKTGKEIKNWGKIDLLKGNETFRFYSDKSLIASVKAKDSGSYCQWSTGDLMVNAYTDSFQSEQDLLIGINGDWNALPRVMTASSDKNTFEVDLDCDGKEELVKIQDFIPKKEFGEFGKRIILVKDGNSMLVSEIVFDDSYFKNEDKDKLELIKIMALDLNGDGRLEIITKVSYGYGVSITAYEIKDNKIKPVLGYYDGD